MSDDNVVDFRSRETVVPRIVQFRSEPSTVPWEGKRYPVEIESDISAVKLIRALGSVGLCFKQDTRTGTVVIMPIAVARQRESQEE